MLDWLNKNIGTDWATYTGVILGLVSLISLVWGGSKILRSKSISQIANVKGGTVIQVGGNVRAEKINESKSSSD
ncbi:MULTISPECIES: hypothetical protein [Nitrosomonas]|uniref:Uncharacterized protein n=1 Tax=Nitrosomonas communis TaxID=44574 RepID=A0A0F7KDC6_9PROT|nr:MULTISPECIES: hypothetical protein [Nitrosomonas]AKH38500.1 hypothetical protein AAW31_12985 [Nitrosomonas communis]TYP89237.1 hypothetical protein BCL69_101812 [Nitrosomonas communis]UVS60541.1 hypothetical protein NX761_13660 [Nitrosomonas sp. PLL12]